MADEAQEISRLGTTRDALDDALRTAVRKGDVARDVMRNEVVAEAFELMGKAYLAELKKCDIKDDIGRHRLIVALNTIDGVKSHLELTIANGDNAVKQAEGLRKRTLTERMIRKF